MLRLGSIRSIVLPTFCAGLVGSARTTRTRSSTTSAILRRRLPNCPCSQSHDSHQHQHPSPISSHCSGQPRLQDGHDDDVDAHGGHGDEDACYEAVAVRLQRGQVDEASAGGVRRYDEDVVVAIWQAAAGRTGIVAVRRRRRRWALTLHGVRSMCD